MKNLNQPLDIHDIVKQTNIKYFYTEYHIDYYKDSIPYYYLEIYHPIYKEIRITENKYLIISNDEKQYKVIIDLTESDWIEKVNEVIPYKLKDIINGLSNLPSYWATMTWGDIVSHKIKSKAIEAALKVVDIIENLNLPKPRIFPQCSGGINFEWTNCGLDFYNDNDIEFFYELSFDERRKDDGQYIEFNI